jgi:hypothetical protein
MNAIATTALPDALGDAAREFISKQHGLLIGDEWTQAADGRTFATFDPATGREIATVPSPRRALRSSKAHGQSLPRRLALS